MAAGISYFQARGNLDFTQGDPDRQARESARVVNLINSGRLNCSASITLAANAATTVIQDVRLSIQSAILLMPTTAHAAAEIASGNLWIVCAAGTATLNHTNNAQTDRTFTVVLLG